MKVLVPVDGSENSLRAAWYVLKTALKDSSVEVTLVTVACSFPGLNSAGVYVDSQEVHRQCMESASRDLDKGIRIFREAGIRVNTEILTGDPGTAIVTYAQEKVMEKIVMGSRGLNPFMGMMLGSVTYKVLQSALIPVTVVK